MTLIVAAFIGIFIFIGPQSNLYYVLDQIILLVLGDFPLVFPALYTLRQTKRQRPMSCATSDGLDLIMSDPDQLKRLTDFMKKEFSIENLMFVLVCALWRANYC